MSLAKKKSEEGTEKRPVQEIRSEIRSYIRNERDTIMKKWLALKESVTSEDRHRDEFYRKKEVNDTRSLPLNILKFIGTIKKAVRNTMRHKGGTPYSIVRSLFVYWDADKSGLISGKELFACMKSLGVKVSITECNEIVNYYVKSDAAGSPEMDYQDFLEDIQRGEPTLIQFVTQQEEDDRDQNELRFEEVADKFTKMPHIVRKFLEAVQAYLLIEMRDRGGTPQHHIGYLFKYFDYDYSNGLDYKELIVACRRKMNLCIDIEQAKQIVEYYDRKHSGQISYEKFVADVCLDVKPVLSFTELTPRTIEAGKKSLRANPFIPKPFAAAPNRILETFKQDIKTALSNKVKRMGGSMASWIREAFVAWDREYTGKISEWRQLQGAAKRLGVNLEEEDAIAIMKCYDRFNTGEMHYNYLTKEIMEEDPHFLMDPKLVASSATTGGTPETVQKLLNKMRKVLDGFVRKSKGKLDGRDILHGTFLRFDDHRSGRITQEAFHKVLEELKISFDESAATAACKWFDSNGSRLLDYNALTVQLYGASDASTERLALPVVNEGHTYANFMKSRSGLLPSLSLNPPASYLTSTVGPTGVSMMMSQSHSVSTNPFISSMTAQNMLRSSEFGVKSSTMEKNLEPVESQAVKNARLKFKRTKMLSEKLKVERKLAAVEEQRRKLIEEYKAKHSHRASHVVSTEQQPETSNISR